MRSPGLLLAILFVFVISVNTHSQTPAPTIQNNRTIDEIATNVTRMTAAVETLNKNWYTFFQTLSSDKGGQYFSDNQKRLLFALEVLNRYEKSLATAQTRRLDLIERQSRLRRQLASVTDDLRPESIDRVTAWRGTTDAQGVRDIRRQALQKEQVELTASLSQLTSDLQQAADDIRRTELQIQNIRTKLFDDIDREMAK